MRTLDEVIKAWSICFSDNSRSNCTGCPYADEDGESACFNHDRDDALHYLKMYRSDQIQWEAAREDWNEKWETFFVARERHLDAVKELKRNDPLSWSELQQMEGKPVWVETSDSIRRCRWMFVGEWFDEDEMRLFDMGNDYPDYVSKKGYESGRWQAYRKERS